MGDTETKPRPPALTSPASAAIWGAKWQMEELCLPLSVFSQKKKNLKKTQENSNVSNFTKETHPRLKLSEVQAKATQRKITSKGTKQLVSVTLQKNVWQILVRLSPGRSFTPRCFSRIHTHSWLKTYLNLILKNGI